jgi:hypothetical protein
VNEFNQAATVSLHHLVHVMSKVVSADDPFDVFMPRSLPEYLGQQSLHF